MMALFPSRYWPEGDEVAESESAGISLEALHQLASQRAEARRKRSAFTGDNDEVSLTGREAKSLKRKRKKKSRQAKMQETDDGKVTLSDAEEQMKQLKVSSDQETDSLKTDSKSSKRKKKTRGRTDKGSPSKDPMVDSIDGEHVDEVEISTPLKRKKRRKKEKHFGDHQEISAEPKANVDHPEQATLLCEAEVVDIDEFGWNDQGSDAIISQSEGEGASAHEDDIITDAQVVEDGEVVVPLMPLGHGETMARERKAVQRQLPQWITEAEIIADDITQQSRSVDDFSLAERVMKNLARIHIDKLFPVQVSVIPELLSYQSGPLLTSPAGLPPRDLCVCAPTGCGKTLCYVIPIVSALLNRAVCQVRAFVVVPSQELAIQVLKVFDQLSHGTPVHCGVLCGSVSFEKERAMLFDSSIYPACSCLDVVIATPGRLVEHLDKKSFCTLRHLRYLVIDEADKLLDHHFNQWLPKILTAVEDDKKEDKIRGGQKSLTSLRNTLLRQCTTSERLQLMFEDQGHSKMTTQFKSSPHYSAAQTTSPLQKLLFSATMTQNPEHLAALNLHRPMLFTVASALQSKRRGNLDTAFTLPKQLGQCTMKCSLEYKPLALLHLLTSEKMSKDMTRVLCFTNSKESTHRLCLLLDAFKLISVGEISSSLGQGKRKMILNDFKNGKIKVLVCSDQMARGMDVEGVSCVVNYDPPRQYQTYLHRAGRTARAGQRGVVFTLLSREEIHSFNTMLRKVGTTVKQLEEVIISSTDLKPFLSHYQQALESLKHQLSS